MIFGLEEPDSEFDWIDERINQGSKKKSHVCIIEWIEMNIFALNCERFREF